jgi:hypothetical protein
MDCRRVEGSLTTMHCASYETGKELIKRGRYVLYPFNHLTTITDRGILARWRWQSTFSPKMPSWKYLTSICVVVDTMIGTRWYTRVEDSKMEKHCFRFIKVLQYYFFTGPQNL